MNAAFHKDTLPLGRQSLQGGVLARAYSGMPLIAMSQRGSADMPMGQRAKVLKAKLAPVVNVADDVILPRGGHRSSFNPSLWPLATRERGAQGRAMLIAPAKLAQRGVALGNGGGQVEEIHSAWREDEGSVARGCDPTLDQRVVGDGEFVHQNLGGPPAINRPAHGPDDDHGGVQAQVILSAPIISENQPTDIPANPPKGGNEAGNRPNNPSPDVGAGAIQFEIGPVQRLEHLLSGNPPLPDSISDVSDGEGVVDKGGINPPSLAVTESKNEVGFFATRLGGSAMGNKATLAQQSGVASSHNFGGVIHHG